MKAAQLRTPAIALVLVLLAAAVSASDPVVTPGKKSLPLPGESFQLNGQDAFVILPPGAGEDVPWVWYAPTLRGLPSKAEVWMFEKFLAEGIAIAGIDVGESFGSPKGKASYSELYDYLVKTRKFRKKPCLLARSRGGLMLYSWAADNPGCVGGVAGIYPVCNIASYPGIAGAAGAFEMSAEQLQEKLAEHNPIDRLAALAKAKVPILHLHGDKDGTVPLEANSAELAKRYKAAGGPVEIEVIAGQGHNMWNGWFQSQKLTDFAIACALGRAPGAAQPKVGEEVTLSGRLDGGMAAIGGESTGWMLFIGEGEAESGIDVNMQGIGGADSFDGAQVTITGKIVTVQYLERGPTPMLKAQKVVRKP